MILFQAFFENDRSHSENDYVKFVMCMLQDNGNFKDVIVAVPSDVQALVLLYNGMSGSNYTSGYHLQLCAVHEINRKEENYSIISLRITLQLQRAICCNFTT